MSVEFENFYNITMEQFYTYVSEIQYDMGFSFHNSLYDLEERKRVELWQNKQGTENVMVWLETVKENEEIPVVVGTDILRTMNEQNVTKLFFYTNGSIGEDVKNIVDSDEHYLFTPTEIIETLLAVEKSNEVVEDIPVRKNVKVPSGFVLIRNYLQANKLSKEKLYVKTEHVAGIVSSLVTELESILSFIDSLEDLDRLSKENQDRLRGMQYALLPQLIKVSSFIFTARFMYIRDELFNAVKECVIYIGSIVDMELLEIMDRHKENMLNSIDILLNVDIELNNYKNELISKTSVLAGKLFIISILVIVLFVILFFLLT